MTESQRLWHRAVLPINSNIEDAIHVLNDVAIKIVLVTDTNGVLVGTISDGDIRRGLLQGLNLSSSVKNIVHYDPVVVAPEANRDLVLQLMASNKIQQIPIVNENKYLVGLHLSDEVSTPAVRSNIMVIMAGGKGTRLHPQTENCPKPLLLVGGKPILEHIIERAKAEGISHFVLAIYHLGHMIEEYFGDGKRFGVNIDYLREESPLGTAGALSLLSPIPNSAFLVTNGDVITDIRYGELLDFHQQQQAKATMAVRVFEWQNPFGVVETEGIEITKYQEKPVSRSQINAGVYVLEPAALSQLINAEVCDMPTLFERLKSQAEHIVAYLIYEPWLDVGRPADLVEAGHKLNISQEKRI
jgi:dTDP-glucose pyrophosphorylase/predicted transcriptional regulator